MSDFTAMNAMVALMALTGALVLGCLVHERQTRILHRSAQNARQARLERQDAEDRAAAAREVAPSNALERSLRRLRDEAMDLLGTALQLEREVEAAVAHQGRQAVGLRGAGQAASRPAQALQSAQFRFNLVVFALAEMLHRDSALSAQTTLLTTTMTTGGAGAGDQEAFARQEQHLQQLNYRLADLKLVRDGVAEAAQLLPAEANAQAVMDRLERASRALLSAVEQGTITSPDKKIGGGASLKALLGRGRRDPAWGAASPSYASLRTRAVGAGEEHVVPDAETAPTRLQRLEHEEANKSELPRKTWFPLARRFPAFYGAYWVLLLAIVASWLSRIGNTDLADYDPSTIGQGGFGVTFFTVPPQYIEVDAGGEPVGINERYATGLPFIYAFMHSALMSLGLLPITMTRGLVRDVAHVWPGVNKWVPTDHFVELHRQLGLFILFLLACGALTWMSMMYPACKDDVPNACAAFGVGVANFANPVDNVMMLRFIVWGSWFLLLSLIAWIKTPTPRWLVSRVGFLRRWWFEVLFYTHVVVAVGTLTLALVARLDIFWPMFISWGPYLVDRLRETLWRPRRISLRTCTTYRRSGEPSNSMHLTFGLAASEDCNCRQGAPAFPVKAGQWVYVLIPAIDLHWHPFSISSESTEDSIELHIGVQLTNGKADWRQDASTGEWEVERDPTWTYKLLRLVDRPDKLDVRGFVRGPYGTAFESCFDPRFGGALVVGAGTGITAAESVLRESVRRRREKIPVPVKFWFVWTCSSVDDLTWCFDRLLDLVVDAAEAGLLDVATLSSAVKTFDWLGVAIYVTKPAEGAIKTFVDSRRMSLAPTRTSAASAATAAAAPTGKGTGSTLFHSVLMETTRTYDAGSLPGPPRPQARQRQPGVNVEPAGDNLELGDAGCGPGSDVGAGGDAGLEGDAGLGPRVSVATRRLVQRWLLRRIFEGSLALPKTHIVRYLRGARRNMEKSHLGDKGLAIGYCGAPALAHTVAEAAQMVEAESRAGAPVQFSADYQ